MQSILIVDGKAASGDFPAAVLKDRGWRLLEAADGAQGFDMVRSKRPDLVITELAMPLLDGCALVRYVVEERAECRQ